MVVDFSCNFAVPIREGELSVFYSAIFANIRNELYMSIWSRSLLEFFTLAEF